MGRAKRQEAKNKRKEANDRQRRRVVNKNDMYQLLQDLFAENPQQTFKMKDIFRELRLNTHPLKMLAIDALDEMAWDDYLKKEGDNAFRLNQGGQVQEGPRIR